MNALTKDDNKTLKIIGIVFLAFVIRILVNLMTHQGGYVWLDTYNYVQHWFKQFYSAGLQNMYQYVPGSVPAEEYVKLNYPPIYYTLMYMLVGKGFTETLLNTGYVNDILLTFLPTLIDFLFVAFIAIKISMKASLVWALYPAVIFNVSDMSQSDGLFSFIIFIFLYACYKKANIRTLSVIFAIMCLTKLQGVYFAPIYLYLLYENRDNKKDCLLGIVIGAAMGLLAYLPFMFANKDIFLPFKVYLNGMGEANRFCFSASNIYFPISAEYSGFWVIISYLLILLCVLAFVLIYRKTEDLAFSIFCYLFFIFMFTFQQHDRYEIYSFAVILFAWTIGSKYVNKTMVALSFTGSSFSALIAWAYSKLKYWHPGVMDEWAIRSAFAYSGLILNVFLLILIFSKLYSNKNKENEQLN